MNTVKISTTGLMHEELQFLPVLMVQKSILNNWPKKMTKTPHNLKIFWVSQNKDILTTGSVPLNIYSPTAEDWEKWIQDVINAILLKHKTVTDTQQLTQECRHRKPAFHRQKNLEWEYKLLWVDGHVFTAHPTPPHFLITLTLIFLCTGFDMGFQGHLSVLSNRKEASRKKSQY